MKFLHISALPVWPIEGKGGMPSLRETLRGHISGGHDLLLALPKYNVIGDYAKQVSVSEDDGYEVLLVPCRWAPSLAAVRRFCRQLGGGKELPYLLRWLLNLGLCVLLTSSLFVMAFRLRFIDKRKFDLVYAHNQYASFAGWIVGKLFNAPNVTRLYGTFLADLIRKPYVRLRYPVATAGFLVPHSLLICANDGTRGDEVAANLGIDMSKFRFWQNGVNLPDSPPKITRKDLMSRYNGFDLQHDNKWILSCSRLSYWKRIDRIIAALHYALKQGASCQLIIAGDGPESERLHAQADDLGVPEHIIWLGAVDHDHIWELMHVSDVFVITNDVTNRCNPLFEAMSAGLPVVSVNDPSTADLLKNGENALLSEKDDITTLGMNIFKVCSNDALSAELRMAQRTTSKSFWTWQERMAVEVRDLEAVVAKETHRI
jgi:glycosyltransferase involved in cell wall biosynthesis